MVLLEDKDLDNNLDMVHQEDNLDMVHQEDNLDMVHQEVNLDINLDMVHQEDNPDMVHQEDNLDIINLEVMDKQIITHNLINQHHHNYKDGVEHIINNYLLMKLKI